jgi:phosphonate transport system substrate-binding protein
MSKLRLGSTVLLFSLFTSPPGIANEAEQAPLRFGSVAADTPAVMHERLKPLTEYLSTALNRPVTLKLSANMSSAINEVASGNVDIAYLTPVAYIKSHDQGSTRILVKTVTRDVPKFRLVIAVNSAGEIKTPADLVGKRFAFGDRAALLHRATLVASGVQLEDLGNYEFLGHYNNIVRGILHKHFDAGVLTETEASKWRDKGLSVIYTSEELPPYNITVSKNVDDALFNQLREIFIKLDDEKPDQKKAIKSLEKDYTGFAATSDSEYDVIRRLVKPFDKK